LRNVVRSLLIFPDLLEARNERLVKRGTEFSKPLPDVGYIHLWIFQQDGANIFNVARRPATTL
jgi:hypothetical protein